MSRFYRNLKWFDTGLMLVTLFAYMTTGITQFGDAALAFALGAAAFHYAEHNL